MELVSEISGTDLWNLSCLNNCSGHGECFNGVCICEIQYEGAECHSANSRYFVGFATVFFALALVSLVQLVTCVLAEWHRMKAPSFLLACRVTTQKFLYLVVFLASTLRGAYFTSTSEFEDSWSSSLMSAYYPLLFSGSSLIVCFWAEVFHLQDIRWEKSQFLSKSFLAFATFNLLAYSLLVAEFYTIHYLNTSPHLKNFYIHIFNGCYAMLLFIVVVFFLIYGVQVFFKVRGGFLVELEHSNKRSQYRQLCISQESLIDTSQLHQSRIGLLSQTLMLSFVVVFLCSETLSEFWKSKVPLHSRNWHDLLFRLVEIGVALWFPCVLWNCMRPEQLWILNPKRIIRKVDLDVYQMDKANQGNEDGLFRTDVTSSLIEERDCCICLEKTDKRMCRCFYIHAECLSKHCLKTGELRCQHCHEQYSVEVVSDKPDWRVGCSSTYCKYLAVLASVITIAAVTGCQLVTVFQHPVVAPFTLGSFCLVLYVCIKCFWIQTDEAWKMARQAGLRVRVLDSMLSDSVKLNLPT